MKSGVVTISCNDDGWEFKLFHHLNQRDEVELGNFDLMVHGRFCHDLAQDRRMATYYDPRQRTMRFFEPSASVLLERSL